MSENTDIEVTGVDLRELVRAAYDLSRPQGLGFLHFQQGSLTDEEVDALVKPPPYGRTLVSLDYVKGRACKFAVWADENGKRWIRGDWYDHTDADLSELLERVGIVRESTP